MAESGIVLNAIQNSLDVAGEALTTLDISHRQIHDGDFYTAWLKSTAVVASSYLDLELIPVSTSKQIHIIFEYNFSGGLAELILAEISTASTYSHGATSINSINNNRLSTKTATMLVFAGSTQSACISSTCSSTQAILIKNYFNGSTGGAVARNEASNRGVDEYILKQNSTTICRIYNRSAEGNANIRATWYEI
jgi:hypothetical protein